MDSDSVSKCGDQSWTVEDENVLLMHYQPDDYQSVRNGKMGDDGSNSPCSSQRQFDIRSSNVIPEDATRQEEPHFSLVRARIVSSLALMVYTLTPSSVNSLIPQYLEHRWREDANLTDSFLANQSVCDDDSNHNDSYLEAADEIQARVSITMTYYTYTATIPSIITCLLLGSYSDIIGRRKLLLSPILATTINLVFVSIIMRFHLNVNFIYLAQAVDGIGGSLYAIFIASFAISADISRGKSRTIIWMVALEAIARVMESVASVTTGHLVDGLGFSYAVLFLAIPVGTGFLVVLFLMPETRPRDDQANESSAWSNLTRIVRIYTSEGSFRDRMALSLCLALLFFIVFCVISITTIDTLYQKHQPFCWSATLIGYYNGVRNVAFALFGSLFIKVIQVCGCLRDEKIAMISTLFQVVGSILEAFVTKTWTFFLVPLVSSPSFVGLGVVRGVMSVLVGPFNQGALFASIAVIDAVCNAVATTALNQMYAATVSTMPGAVYLLLAGVGVLTFLLFGPFFYFYDEPSNRPVATMEASTPEGEETRTHPAND